MMVPVGDLAMPKHLLRECGRDCVLAVLALAYFGSFFAVVHFAVAKLLS